METNTKKISVPQKLYEELGEIARKKGDTLDHLANDIITTGLKKEAE